MILASMVRNRLLWLFVLLLGGCQIPPTGTTNESSPSIVGQDSAQLAIEAPMAWGGALRCSAQGCLLGIAKHESSEIALYKLDGRKSSLLDQQSVAYHPDSAAWMSDHLLVAAVEGSSSLDIFRVVDDKLVRVQQVPIGFAPRDVMVVKFDAGVYTLLATPYSGQKVAWVRWSEDGHEAVKVQSALWCKTPWHPTRANKIPGVVGGGLVVACLDDHKVIGVSDTDEMAPPHTLAQFEATPRQVRLSPSGRWLYVALETGGRNARINMETGALQWIAAPPAGSVSIAPMGDDLVIWGSDRQLSLQRLDAQGVAEETRWLKTSGFSTGLQLVDADRDGEPDVVVYNSAGDRVDVIFGPLWEQAAKTAFY